MRFTCLTLLSVLALTSRVLPAKMCVTIKEDKWRQIAVLQSTRSDVERLFGKSKYEGYSVAYDLEEGRLDVEYSGFNFCAQGQGAGWNVSEWTVVEVTYHFNKPPRFSSMNLDLTRFKKVRESPHSPDMISYVNNGEGIAYVVSSEGELIEIRYFPPVQYNNLRCRK
jgi:hypothetical protein